VNLFTKISFRKCLLSSGSWVRIPPGTPPKLPRATAFSENVHNVVQSCSSPTKLVSCQSKEFELTTLFDALAAYRICAKAEGKSPKTIKWVTSSVTYFSNFLGDNPDIEAITANDLRGFIIGLQDTHKFSHHPFNKP